MALAGRFNQKAEQAGSEYRIAVGSKQDKDGSTIVNIYRSEKNGGMSMDFKLDPAEAKRWNR